MNLLTGASLLALAKSIYYMTPPNITTRSRGNGVTLSVPQVLVYKINNTPFVYRPILWIIYGPLYHFKRVSRSRFVSTSSYIHVKIKPSNVTTNSNILSQWLHIFLLKFSHFVNGQYFIFFHLLIVCITLLQWTTKWHVFTMSVKEFLCAASTLGLWQKVAVPGFL